MLEIDNRSGMIETDRRSGARVLDVSRDGDLLIAAEIIGNKGIAALPFGTIFGIFARMDDPIAALAIHKIKERPPDQKLITVIEPEEISDYVDFSRIPYTEQQIRGLWEDTHALGIILPASKRVPAHLVTGEGDESTFINIWANSPHLITIMGYLHGFGVKGLVGTSANEKGEPTIHRFDLLSQVFDQQVDVLVKDSFDHLPAELQVSTTILVLTSEHPSLYRLGSVGVEELEGVLQRQRFPSLVVPENYHVVLPRGE
ncbi:Sua5/YciO/YrdC/YwlC family protein [Patescibacteria group bacterium]|nr:Sua5/YciO/YrdC/YwlC family protein [Patescibacteria group bacterium]